MMMHSKQNVRYRPKVPLTSSCHFYMKIEIGCSLLVNLSLTLYINNLVTAHYTEGSLFRRFEYSEGSLFRRFVIPKVRYSEGSLFRRSVIPKHRRRKRGGGGAEGAVAPPPPRKLGGGGKTSFCPPPLNVPPW